MTSQQDAELKEVLDKIDWHKYLDYGSVRIQVQAGKKAWISIERTYTEKGTSLRPPKSQDPSVVIKEGRL